MRFFNHDVGANMGKNSALPGVLQERPIGVIAALIKPQQFIPALVELVIAHGADQVAFGLHGVVRAAIPVAQEVEELNGWLILEQG